MTTGWSKWCKFPDPRQHGMLAAPFGPGCYELRLSDTGRLILFGTGRNVAFRMTSLLPKPLGQGRRDNDKKRTYVLQHIENVEYRTLACTTCENAKARERELKANKLAYIFRT